ncbi:universal stress protein [Cardiobacteriaceae bacterium TAE3-ERU3]|nr:universal stress protein [Cardiobacteriaceae bacterium TAE3-ERU3]
MTYIIAALDNSDQQHHVIDAAIWAASRRGDGIRFVHALEKPTDSKAELSGNIGLGTREHLQAQLVEMDAQRSRMAYEHGLLLLKDAAQIAIDAGIEELDMQQRHDELLPTLLNYSKDASLFVMGRRGTKHSEKEAIGTHIETVTRRVEQPVLLTTGEFTAPKAVMIAYDGRETALDLIRKIADGPILHGLDIHVVMIGDDKLANHEALDKAAQLLAHTGGKITPALVKSDDTLTAINQYITDHDIGLLVMGAFANNSVRRLFLGSKTLKMIAASQVPLLIMR